jgi:5-formyltetrahydrofolate cyclo-ligase
MNYNSKSALRKTYLQKRKTLSDSEVLEFNNRINLSFIDFLPQDIKTIHIYLPIRSKAEIDTWRLVHGLWAKNIRVVAPAMDSHKNTISSMLLTKDTQLVENEWKIPEPSHSPEIDEKEIDAVVVPLLAFNKKGYRVGYGKGYYDRFLASMNPKILKIGLSFFPPVDQISDIDPWDIPMDFCITPDSIIKF